MQNWEACIDRAEFCNLCDLASKDQELALGYCETVMSADFESFKDFLNSQRRKETTCTVTWKTRTLVVVCRDCQRDKGAEICLSCFKKSDHEGHNVSLRVSRRGRCACGDICRWKLGCSDHITNEKIAQVNTVEQKTLYIALFAAVLSDLKLTATYSKDKFCELCDWFSQLVALNDDMRQCVMISWIQQNCWTEMIKMIDIYEYEVNERLAQFLGQLMSDHTFLVKYAKEAFKYQCTYAELLVRAHENGIDDKYMLPMIQISSCAYTSIIIDAVIGAGFEWHVGVVKFFKIVTELIHRDPTGKLFAECHLETIIDNMCTMLECALRIRGQGQRVQDVFDSLLVLFSRLEGSPKFKLRVPSESGDSIEVHAIMKLVARVAAAFENSVYAFDSQVLFAVLFKFLADTLLPDRFDNDKSLSLWERSLFDSALYSPIFPCHLVIGSIMSQRKDDIIPYSHQYLGTRIHVNEFCLYLSILPMRWQAICHLTGLKVMPVESRCVKFLAKRFTEDILECGFVPFFTMLQNLMGLIQDKDTLIKEMAHVYGVFFEHEDAKTTKMIKFAFFYALSCLLTDTLCMKKDYREMGRCAIICSLFLRPQSAHQLSLHLPAKCLENLSLDDELAVLADPVKRPRENLWKLKNGVTINPFLPWGNPSIAINVMLEYQKNHQNELFPFPHVRETTRSFSFSPVLSSPVLLAIMYSTLAEFLQKRECMSSECVHIILNLLILRSQTNQIHEKQVISPVKLKDTRALTLYLQNLVFVRAVWTPFDLEIFSLGPQSFVDLISKIGPVGLKCLASMNIGYVSEAQEQIDKRSQAKMLKEKLAQEFRDKQAQFGLAVEDMPEEESFEGALCSVCNQPAAEGSVLCYPALMYNVSILLKDDNPDAFCLRLCQHLVHESCIADRDGGFRCPIDRFRRSILIPAMENIGFSTPSDKVISMLRQFRLQLSERVRSLYEVEALVRSLIHQIAFTEMRLRVPATVDANTVLLIKNLFFILWHMRNTLHLSLGMIDDTPMGQLIATLIEDPRLSDAFPDAVKHQAQGFADSHLLTFLRQATILYILVFHDEDTQNFPACLSRTAISERFGVPVPDVPLDSFKLMDLPDNFIDLSLPPHNYPLGQMDKHSAICLLTGKEVDMTKTSQGYTSFLRHLDDECNGNTTLVLYITGHWAGTMAFASRQFNNMKGVPSIYVDSHGDEDPGWTRGKFLRLDKERYARYTDMLLSGEWTDLDTPV